MPCIKEFKSSILQMLLEENKILNQVQELSFDNTLNHKSCLSHS